MSLEDKVQDKESKGFIKKAGRLAWKLGMAAATTALSTSLVGMGGVLIGGALATGGAIGGLIRKEHFIILLIVHSLRILLLILFCTL